MDKLLILGGSGFLGRSLCEQLIVRSGGAGGPITVPSRRPARAKHLQLMPTLRVVQADIFDLSRLTRLLVGQHAVINLVATLHGTQAEFQRMHVELPRILAKACRAAGVRRLIHISALGVGAEAPSHYLRSKAGGEAVIAASGLEATVLRPSVMFGEYDHFLNLFARLQSMVPMVPLAGAEARFQPVWVNDVAAAIVRSLDDPTTIGQTFECAGPRVYTLAEIVRLAGRWSGHERKVVALPSSLGRMQARFMELLPGEPLMSRDNLDSMRVPNVAGGYLPGLEQLGILPAAMDGIAPGYLAADQGIGRLDRWRAGASKS